MQRPHGHSAPLPDPTVRMSEGWHCLHMYYQIDQQAMQRLQPAEIPFGRAEVIAILDPAAADSPARLQTSVISGHKADLGLMMMDPDPLKIDAVTQKLRASRLGTVLRPAWSFVSITEVSEYVPTVEQYAERLRREGTAPDDPAFQAKLNAYSQRLPAMNQQRLYPDIPPFPCVTFYPMNKIRHPQANWYTEPFSVRSELMAEHATSGIRFAGKVSQLITASTGYDDWEWGVTLVAHQVDSIKESVYEMRFDEVSAKYGEFGPFYVNMRLKPAEVWRHLKL